MPGLAHFCEHLLFMVSALSFSSFPRLTLSKGTEQFPRENEYSEVSGGVSSQLPLHSKYSSTSQKTTEVPMRIPRLQTQITTLTSLRLP